MEYIFVVSLFLNFAFCLILGKKDNELHTLRSSLDVSNAKMNYYETKIALLELKLYAQENFDVVDMGRDDNV